MSAIPSHKGRLRESHRVKLIRDNCLALPIGDGLPFYTLLFGDIVLAISSRGTSELDNKARSTIYSLFPVFTGLFLI